MASRYRKLPVVIEAMRWTRENLGDLREWAGARNVADVGDQYPLLRLFVAANGAWLNLETGEWIIRDARGFYPCKAEIFDATYEAVPDGE